jgi:hypothetical protein
MEQAFTLSRQHNINNLHDSIWGRLFEASHFNSAILAESQLLTLPPYYSKRLDHDSMPAGDLLQADVVATAPMDCNASE